MASTSGYRADTTIFPFLSSHQFLSVGASTSLCTMHDFIRPQRRNVIIATYCMLALAAAMPHAFATGEDSASTLVTELGLEEAGQRVDQRAQWRRPRKIIVRADEFIRATTFPGLEWLQPAAPDVRLVAVKTVEEAIEQARDADAVLGWCDARILAAGPRIRWIQFFFAGVENCVSVPAIREGSVLLTNMQRTQSPVMAEHVIALMLGLARGLDLGVAQTPAREWRAEAFSRSGRLRVLKGKTLLVAGLGGTGTEVAWRAHALGMRVIATRARKHTRPEFVSYVGTPEELATLVADADVIVNTLPLTPATRGIFDERMFSAMKRSALFINVGRGGTVVTSALVRALQAGTLGGAGLDVTDPEPLPADQPLWQAPNIILTPHIASESDLGVTRVWEIVRENLRRYVAGDRMLSVVDANRGY
jgi:phosphoglycerate dehydrogenase-like enzyme